ncbi:PHP domain-containing protein [Streptomyces sp. CA-135486]|uniref:PHP domain-containing protein n=1 Tax=Streptomyces sp. CA-135486 TaxID=3240049 RepID=UPI003D90A30C
MSFPPARAVGRGAAWYRGDCHVHSVHSDGELTPEELAVRARAARLDFIATTEHNSATGPGTWGHLAADDFLILLGEEVTTKTGHWLALGIKPGEIVDWNHQVRDGLIGQCLDQVHQAEGLCVAAHPHAPCPSGDFMFPFRGFDVAEVWNGLWTSNRPWNADNEAALAERGRILAAGIHTDSWQRAWATATPTWKSVRNPSSPASAPLSAPAYRRPTHPRTGRHPPRPDPMAVREDARRCSCSRQRW